MSAALESKGSIDWTKLTTVLVGPAGSEKKFIAHTDVLKRIDFFRACLDSNWKESQENLVRLPEDPPEIFRDLLYLAYHGRFESDFEKFRELPAHFSAILSHVELYVTEVMRRLSVYLLARKFCCEKASNCAIDSFMPTVSKLSTSDAVIVLRGVIENTELSDPIRSKAKAFLASCIKNEGGWLKWKAKNSLTYESKLRESPECMEFLLEALSEYPDIQGLNSGEQKCAYHIHVTTPKCANGGTGTN